MADQRTVTTTLLVDFGGAGDGGDALIAEVDSRPDGLNKGKTNFAPGEEVFILVYRGSNVTITDVVASAGKVSLRPALSPQITEQEQDVVFSNKREEGLSRPVNVDGFSHEWLGNDLGSPLLVTETELRIPEQAIEPFIGIARIEYQSAAVVYKLSNTALPFEEYQIGVFFTGIAT